MAIYRLTPNAHANIRWPKQVDVRAPNERRARLVASRQLACKSNDSQIWIKSGKVICNEINDSPFPKTGEVTVLIPRLTSH